MQWMQYGNVPHEIGNQVNAAISPEQMAHSMSLLNRFTGHTHKAYSVAQHSCHVSDLCMVEAGAITAMYGLIHDVHETVMNDVSTPVKLSLSPSASSEIDLLESGVDRFLYGQLGVPYPVPEGYRKTVKKADLVMLATERRDLMPPCDRDWNLIYEALPARVLTVDPWPTLVARASWLARYNELRTYIEHIGGYPHAIS